MGQSFEMILATQCAPTLAGVKPASLFRWTPERTAGQAGCGVCAGGETETWWGRVLSPFGIRMRLMKRCPFTGGRLVYLYREQWLHRILDTEEIRGFLSGMGYDVTWNSVGLLHQLGQRLCAEARFPHEIGVFLGYPLEDVTGFIENHGRNYTCLGCWKAYGDPEIARQRFEQFHRCTAACQESVRAGVPLTEFIATA